MPLGVWNQEFLAQNGQRHYPLADDATVTDVTGSFKLPDDVVVELDLPIHSGLDVSPAGFFLMSVAAFAGGYGLVVGYQPAAGPAVQVATALIPRQGFTRNSVYTLGGIGDYADTIGKVVIGRLESIDAQPAGFWQFALADGRLDPDAVRPIIRGVSSLACVIGGQASVPLYGDVQLVAGSNMRITAVLADGVDPVIRFDAIQGEGTVEDCACAGSSPPPVPITTINGVAPSAGGNLVVLGSDCVVIAPIANGIRVTDTCSKPCCGCPELEQITADLVRLGDQATTVEGFVTRLGNAVDTMGLVVLGSKLGDTGCASH